MKHVTVNMKTIHCPTCGMMFCVPDDFARSRMDFTGLGCPNRHDLWYDHVHPQGWRDRAQDNPHSTENKRRREAYLVRERASADLIHQVIGGPFE